MLKNDWEKRRILGFLRECDQPIDEAALSEPLQISEEVLKEHLRELYEQGYIEALTSLSVGQFVPTQISLTEQGKEIFENILAQEDRPPDVWRRLVALGEGIASSVDPYPVRYEFGLSKQELIGEVGSLIDHKVVAVMEGLSDDVPQYYCQPQTAGRLRDLIAEHEERERSHVPEKQQLGGKAVVDPRKVFVVHGRNEKLRDAMFQFLRALGLDPIEWEKAVSLTGKGSPFVGEILDAAFSHAQAVVVLLTPDDETKLRQEFVKERDPDYERELTPQARPNVLFEAGMALGRNPDRTILVEIGDLRPFSDVAGRHTIKMDNTSKKRNALAQRLATAGCPVSREGDDWLAVGDFDVDIGNSQNVSVESAQVQAPSPILDVEFVKCWSLRTYPGAVPKSPGVILLAKNLGPGPAQNIRYSQRNSEWLYDPQPDHPKLRSLKDGEERQMHWRPRSHSTDFNLVLLWDHPSAGFDNRLEIKVDLTKGVDDPLYIGKPFVVQKS